MTARRIFLSPAESRGLLAGRVSLLLRPVTPQPIIESDGLMHWKGVGWTSHHDRVEADMRRGCRWGVPGDTLWGAEPWALPPDYDAKRHGNLLTRPRIGPVCFRTDYTSWMPWTGTKWRSSATMPRWASRHVLTLASVRVVRVRELSEEDALAVGGWEYGNCPVHKNPQESVRVAWTARYGARYPWESAFAWALGVEVAR